MRNRHVEIANVWLAVNGLATEMNKKSKKACPD
jgi:hypothetical protein